METKSYRIPEKTRLSIMGNQRQLLKNNIEKELVSKIEAAKDVLNQLNKNLETNKQNSLNAKEEIRVTADLIKEVLIKRKKELIKEVENLHHAQARPLNDAIKSTYITMGKLQSMLANLDSFDQSQLVGLQIPAVDTSCTLIEPAQIKAALECEKLKEELKEWGSVSDELQFDMLDDVQDNLRRDGNKQTCSTSKSALAENKENQMTDLAEPNQQSPWASWGIETWLSRSGSKRTASSGIKDETDQEMEFIVLQDNDSGSNQLDDCSREEDESNSSIMCIEKDNGKLDELSIWLKPKKSKMSQNVPLELQLEQKDKDALVTLVQAENILKSLSLEKIDMDRKANNCVGGKKSLEFPCLNMSPDTWIRKRKTKASVFSSSASACSNSNKSMSSHLQNHIDKLKLTPPTYALPTPFWLKKYQKR